MSIRYTQVLLKCKTKAKNVTLQTHNLQRTSPCKCFQQAVGQTTLTKDLPDHSYNRFGHIFEDLSTTPDNMEEDSLVSEYWTKELPVKRKRCSTQRLGEYLSLCSDSFFRQIHFKLYIELVQSHATKNRT